MPCWGIGCVTFAIGRMFPLDILCIEARVALILAVIFRPTSTIWITASTAPINCVCRSHQIRQDFVLRLASTFVFAITITVLIPSLLSCQTYESMHKIKKMEVQIAINGKQKHIGRYSTFEEAVKIRKEQEAIHYKEFQAFQSEMEQLEYEFEQLIK